MDLLLFGDEGDAEILMLQLADNNGLTKRVEKVKELTKNAILCRLLWLSSSIAVVVVVVCDVSQVRRRGSEGKIRRSRPERIFFPKPMLSLVLLHTHRRQAKLTLRILYSI